MSLLLMFLITFVIIQVSVFATTMYLHRSLTHRGIDFHASVALFFHAWLTMFTGISPRQWVAVHRKHHQYSDKEGDPHSPYLLGLWQVFFGNAFYYRKVANDPAALARYTRDYKGTIIDKVEGQGYGILVGYAIFVALFGWAWGSGLFVFQAVAYVLLNSSINSICHMIGYRNFDNLATNLQSLALFTGGEALHNNHHEYPSAAHFAMGKREFDPAWPIIRVLEVTGLAKVKRLPIAKAA